MFDGERYQAFEGIPAFMRALLTRENRGAWIFAHFGGAADIAFLQEWFTEHKEYEVEMRFSGSAAVVVQIKKGKDEWFLVDSFFLMRDKLANIGRSIGMLKGTDGMTEAEKEAQFNAPIGELKAYNEQDCRILFQAITLFAAELEELGGEMRPTIASCAMTLFRRRYLREPMRVSDALNDTFRDSYIASRVEVYRRRLVGGANKYDINSSFPASLAEKVPGSCIGLGTKIPRNGDCFIAECDVDVADCYLPPLPYRISGRIFFPTGKWSTLLTGPDFRFAEEHGAIRRVRMVWTFQERTDAADYVHKIYGMRKAEKDPFRKLLLKYLLNSLYGKFGEAPAKQVLLINPPAPLHMVEGATYVRPGVWLLTTHDHAKHEHVALAAHVTANSRRRITRYLQQAGDAYYCDTDSVITKSELPDSDELGHLKNEGRVESGYFAAPKFYLLDDKVKAKGFPRLQPEDFWRVVEGGSAEVSRMARPREMWRSGDLSPVNLTMQKRARLTVDKRCFDAAGESRPWTVAEVSTVIGQVPEQTALHF
jgi:hypothetical protein